MLGDLMDERIKAFQFGEWFEQTFGLNPGDRFWTWKLCLSLGAQWGMKNIVETGCQRMRDDWGAGCSTLIFGKVAEKFDCNVWTVDISQTNLDLAKAVAEEAGVANRINFVCQDSAEFLQNFPAKIDFLYLDSYDWYPDEPELTACQEHQLKEIKAVYNLLSDRAIVVLDDNSLPGGGKTRLTKEWLASRGWTCLLDWQQSVWIRASLLY